MKKVVFTLTLSLIFIANSVAQNWMLSFDVAKRLALVQNKMLLMVWEDSTYDYYPVYLNHKTGYDIYVEDIFDNPEVIEYIQKFFVPVIVSEHLYEDWYDSIKDIYGATYLEKFNDNSLKVMDVNGVILNTKNVYFDGVQNLTKLIESYALNTEYLSNDYKNYLNEGNYYSAKKLAEKYRDFAIFSNEKIRRELLKVSENYLKITRDHAKKSDTTFQKTINQKCDLISLSNDLVLNKVKKVLRKLKKIDSASIEESNLDLYNFLHYTAYYLRQDKEGIDLWQSKISSVFLKKAQGIINLYRK